MRSLCQTRPAVYDVAAPAPWRSGYAAACKAVYTGSIPVGASRNCPRGRDRAEDDPQPRLARGRPDCTRLRQAVRLISPPPLLWKTLSTLRSVDGDGGNTGHVVLSALA